MDIHFSKNSIYYNHQVTRLIACLVIGGIFSSCSSPHITQAGDIEIVKPTSELSQIRAYSQLPISFEENHGNATGKFEYLTRGQGYVFLISSDETGLILQPSNKENGMGNVLQPAMISTHFRGSNRDADLSGSEVLPGKVNYLLGRGSKEWRTGLSTYRSVRVSNIYPGIDLRYHGDRSRLEYDFIVHPNSAVEQIQLAFGDTDNVSVDESGDLVLTLDDHNLRYKKPVIYQDVRDQRVAIEGRYHLIDKNTVGFIVGQYDPEIPLIIDPILDYASYFGGKASDAGLTMTVDNEGNTYIAGTTSSVDLLSSETSPYFLNGHQDSFVTKISPDGRQILYTTYLGGRGYLPPHRHSYHWGGFDPWGDQEDEEEKDNWWEEKQWNHFHNEEQWWWRDRESANDIAVDATGQIIITGYTNSNRDFPLVNPVQANYGGGESDGYIAKLSPDGSTLLYATYLGGREGDEGIAVAIGEEGEIVIAGNSESNDYPVVNALQDKGEGQEDIVLTRLTEDGQTLLFSTYLGGHFQDEVSALTLDQNGDILLTGQSRSPDFPITANAAQKELNGRRARHHYWFQDYPGNPDAILTCLSADGQTLLYSTFLGGKEQDSGTDLAISAEGGVILTGWTTSWRDFPVTNDALQVAYGGGGSDGFIARISQESGSLDYASYWGEEGFDQISALAVGPEGSIWIAGNSEREGHGFRGFHSSRSRKKQAVFITQLNAELNDVIFSTELGGSGDDRVLDMATDGINGIYVTGITRSSRDFPLENAVQPFYGGGRQDAFIAKFIDDNIILNSPPVITSEPVTEVFVTDPYQYDVEAEDADGDILTFSLFTGPEGMTIDPQSGLINWTPSEQGAYQVEVQVDDGQGNNVTQPFTITVPNRAPSITSSPMTEFNLINQYLYQVTANDEDNDPLTYSLITAPGGMVIDPASGVILWEEPVAGEHAVNILVEDSYGGSDAQNFNLTVTDSPVIYSNPATITQTDVRYFYDVAAFDPNELPLSYILNTAPQGMTIDATTGHLEWVPDSPGDFPIEIVVTNRNGQTASQTFALSVYADDDIIIVSEPETEGFTETDYQYQVSAVSFSDDVITYTLLNSPPGMSIDSASGSITWTPANAGEFTVEVQAANEQGNTTNQSYTVIIKTLEEMDVMFNQMWDGMFADLIAGRKNVAMQSLTGEAQRKYGPVFDALLPYVGEIAENYSELVRLSINPDIAEYMVRRTGGDGMKIFIVSFLRDFEGNWKLNGM